MSSLVNSLLWGSLLCFHSWCVLVAGVPAGHLWPETSSLPSQCFRGALCCRDFSAEVGFLVLVGQGEENSLSVTLCLVRKLNQCVLSYGFVFFTTHEIRTRR